MPSFAFRNDISGDFLLFDMLFWANLTLLSVILLVAPESPAAFFDLFQCLLPQRILNHFFTGPSAVENFPERKPGLHHGSTDISVMSEFWSPGLRANPSSPPLLKSFQSGNLACIMDLPTSRSCLNFARSARWKR